MHYFNYENNELYCESVRLADIAAKVGTPAYVYSTRTIKRHFNAFSDALQSHDHLLCYSVKANSNLSILQLLAEMGSGFDIVSGGELFRVLKAGGDPQKVVFSGVGKTEEEMRSALEANILSFNVESLQELVKLNQIAKDMGQTAPVSLRVNPDIDPQTHPYISTGLKENKFGIPMQEARTLYQNATAYDHIEFIGIDCHIGSQMLSLKPIIDTLKTLKQFILDLRKEGITLRHLNLGGGLGIRYQAENPPSPQDYLKEVIRLTQDLQVKLLFEPGRSIMGNAGVLLTEVLYTKEAPEKSFVIVDAGMNDLIRPALYSAFQDVWAVTKRDGKTKKVDVVGPVCESGDFLAKDRELPEFTPGDLMAVMSSGAYGFTMASNYNTRRNPVEVLVDNASFRVCRKRQSYDDLIAGETL